MTRLWSAWPLCMFTCVAPLVKSSVKACTRTAASVLTGHARETCSSGISAAESAQLRCALLCLPVGAPDATAPGQYAPLFIDCGCRDFVHQLQPRAVFKLFINLLVPFCFHEEGDH